MLCWTIRGIKGCAVDCRSECAAVPAEEEESCVESEDEDDAVVELFFVSCALRVAAGKNGTMFFGLFNEISAATVRVFSVLLTPGKSPRLDCEGDGDTSGREEEELSCSLEVDKSVNVKLDESMRVAMWGELSPNDSTLGRSCVSVAASSGCWSNVS